MLQVLHYRVKIISIDGIETIQPHKLAIKEAKDKYFHLDHQQTTIEGNNLKEIPKENIITKNQNNSDTDNETNTENSADFGEASSSFEEIEESIVVEQIVETKPEDKISIRKFSDAVLAAVAASAEKATGVLNDTQPPKLNRNISTLSAVNSVPKPPRYSLENDKRSITGLAIELETLLDKQSNRNNDVPDLPKTLAPVENTAISFAKTNLN